ncbi:MAG: hypothetical protein ACFFAS_00415 [Promethearchaeota archaeon]
MSCKLGKGLIRVKIGNDLPFHLTINNTEIDVDYFIAPKVS